MAQRVGWAPPLGAVSTEHAMKDRGRDGVGSHGCLFVASRAGRTGRAAGELTHRRVISARLEFARIELLELDVVARTRSHDGLLLLMKDWSV